MRVTYVQFLLLALLSRGRAGEADQVVAATDRVVERRDHTELAARCALLEVAGGVDDVRDVALQSRTQEHTSTH